LRLAAPDGVQMGKIIGFVSKSELERLRLIREARAIYDSIFPPADPVRAPPVGDAIGPEPAPSKGNVRVTGRS
jgi:hypothetical protein